MRRAIWPVGSNGRFRIDVTLGSLTLVAMIDTGLVDPHRRVGFEIEPDLYDCLRLAGELSLLRRRRRIDVSGKSFVNEVGQTTARLIDPIARRPIGLEVRIDVMRGAPGVPSRAGTEFYPRLAGCRVEWELDGRLWCVEFP